jgi:hypothetical protein
MDAQEAIDRIEIHALLTQYWMNVDRREWDAVKAVFVVGAPHPDVRRRKAPVSTRSDWFTLPLHGRRRSVTTVADAEHAFHVRGRFLRQGIEEAHRSIGVPPRFACARLRSCASD